MPTKTKSQSRKASKHAQLSIDDQVEAAVARRTVIKRKGAKSAKTQREKQ
jgi:hypothetical protein